MVSRKNLVYTMHQKRYRVLFLKGVLCGFLVKLKLQKLVDIIFKHPLFMMRIKLEIMYFFFRVVNRETIGLNFAMKLKRKRLKL